MLNHKDAAVGQDFRGRSSRASLRAWNFALRHALYPLSFFNGDINI